MKHIPNPQTASLAKKILDAKRAYYAGHAIMPDEEFDHLEAKLRALDSDHPVLRLVGTDLSSSSASKVTHGSPMLSLEKTYIIEDVLSWQSEDAVLGTEKIDGTSLSLIFKSGKLQLAKTRGNGLEGEDVTQKALWVPGIASIRPGSNEEFEVRGELFCSEEKFSELVKTMTSLGLDPPSSSRNIVAGVLGRKEHFQLASYFDFFAFEVIGVDSIKTEYEKFDWLHSLGFSVPDHRLLKSHDDVKNYLLHIQDLIQRKTHGIDGAVFTFNDLKKHLELGTTSHHPRYKLSFKWQGETARSKILNIIWQTSRFGVLTPVAVIEPVYLSGASITNVTLHNAAHVKTHDLKPGDEIEIVRSGEVIPKFLKVISSSKAIAASIPTRCTSCNGPVIEDDIRIQCLNVNSCPAQVLGRILHWTESVGIDDLSEKRLQQMIDAGLIKNISDLYFLTFESVLTLPGTKEKLASKIITNIQKSKTLEVSVFLNGLGISGVGLVGWQKICQVFPTIEQLKSAQKEQIAEIDGFAEKSAQAIVQGLDQNKSLIQSLLEAGITLTVSDTPAALAGQTIGVFVVTGSLSKPRADIEQDIRKNGGKLGATVSKQTKALITNDQESSSSKFKKAKELGIPIWSEDKLYEFLSKN